MRTSELAGQVGVNSETLRYYERRGLVPEPPRTAGGYRDYPSTAVELLRFIKRAQELGFTLDEVEELLHLDTGGPDSCDAARALAKTRKLDLEARIADLQRMSDSLGDLIATCELPRADRSCALLEAIEKQSTGRPTSAKPASEPSMRELSLVVLHVPDCPNLSPMLDRLRQVTDAPMTTREVRTDAEAAQLGMAGSPTLLVDGVDPFAEPGRCERGVSCRLYRDEQGVVVPAPSVDQLRDALAAADRAAAGAESATPGEVLSAWRTRALPMGPVERAVHRTILRAFASTGRPPATRDLEPVVAGSGSRTRTVLETLHESDAIRLDPDGQIAVAYPFSSAPTRHRVRIVDRIDVYAMCAIDALGISAMLGEGTRIDSIDVTTGQPITVTMTAGHTSWEPRGAVVFIGSDSGGGPSADCCCDYLNFFIDQATATAWTATHPHIPGQILTPAEAEDLGARLFGHLLAPNVKDSTDDDHR